MQKFTTPTDSGHAGSYKACARLQVPFVCVTPARKYAYIQFDVYEMVKPHGLPDEQPADFVIDLYKCYARFFDLPKERFSYSGGSNNLGFTVYKEHAEVFANQLFDHLLRFVKSQRSANSTDSQTK